MSRRSLKLLLLGLIVVISGSVFWSYRNQTTRPGPAPMPSEPAGRRIAPNVDRSTGVFSRSFKGASVSWTLRAKSGESDESGEQRVEGDVVFTVDFTVQGQRDTSTITAARARYSPAGPKGVFRGGVRLVTGQGLELTTDSLTFDGQQKQLRTDDAVQFKRKAASGSCRGLIDHVEVGRIEMLADVVLRIADEVQGPTVIRSRTAEVVKLESVMRFSDNVDLTQPGNQLYADRLNVFFEPESRLIQKLKAFDNVRLEMSGQTVGGVTLVHQKTGHRSLRCRRLEWSFRPDRTIEDLTAGPDGAELIVHPAAGRPARTQRIAADRLSLRFDSANRVESVNGGKNASLTVTDQAPGGRAASARPAASESIHCQGLDLALDPASSTVQRGEFRKNVVFERGSQRATAQKAIYESSLLMLRDGQPELVDAEAGSRLTAESINLGMDEHRGDIRARGQVRHSARTSKTSGFLQGGEVWNSSRFFNYVAKTQTATYRDQAVLRAGRDEIRANLIELQDLGAGRQITAREQVVALWGQAGDPKAAAAKRADAKGAQAVEARAGRMDYDEQRQMLTFSGAVGLQQGDMITRNAQKATIQLDQDGGLRQLEASGEALTVEVKQRQATGARLLYRPQDDLITVSGRSGRPATLRDGSSETTSQKLSFKVNDNTVRAEGGSQRTLTRFNTKEKREP